MVTSIDSIFQNPKGGNVAVIAGTFQSLGHNIFSDDPAVSLSPTDLVNTDPLLGLFTSNNGGNTQTQRHSPAAPRLNGGIGVPGITTDQRGDPRPSSGPTDIGAFQIQPPLTVVSVHRSGHPSLGADLQLAAGRLPGPIPGQLPALPRRRVQSHGLDLLLLKYSAASESVTVRLKTQLLLSHTYVLTVIGTPPGGLTTTVGAYLAVQGPPNQAPTTWRPLPESTRNPGDKALLFSSQASADQKLPMSSRPSTPGRLVLAADFLGWDRQPRHAFCHQLHSIDSIFQNSQRGNVAVVEGSFASLGYNLLSDVPDIVADPLPGQHRSVARSRRSLDSDDESGMQSVRSTRTSWPLQPLSGFGIS